MGIYIYEEANRKLDILMFKCLRWILKIRWPYVVSNEEILKRTKVMKISDEVKTRRWKWIGHVLRMKDDNNCLTALSWKHEGRRKVGRLRTTWRRTVEKERKERGWRSWDEARPIARNRADWSTHCSLMGYLTRRE